MRRCRFAERRGEEGGRIVDQRIEAAETADGVRDQLGQAIEFRQVCLQHVRAACALRFQRRSNFVAFGARAPAVHRDVVPGGVQPACDRGAEARAPPG